MASVSPITPTKPGGDCSAAYLASIVNDNPDNYGPCLAEWIRNAKAGAGRIYGGQMGSDTVEPYVDRVKHIIFPRDKNWAPNQIDDSTWWGDTGSPVGLDISTAGNPVLTSNATINNAPKRAHMVPFETRPTK